MNEEKAPLVQVQNITLRDYFAAAALTGFLYKGFSMHVSIEYAYEAADMMLIEREKTNESSQ